MGQSPKVQKRPCRCPNHQKKKSLGQKASVFLLY